MDDYRWTLDRELTRLNFVIKSNLEEPEIVQNQWDSIWDDQIIREHFINLLEAAREVENFENGSLEKLLATRKKLDEIYMERHEI